MPTPELGDFVFYTSKWVGCNKLGKDQLCLNIDFKVRHVTGVNFGAIISPVSDLYFVLVGVYNVIIPPKRESEVKLLSKGQLPPFEFFHSPTLLSSTYKYATQFLVGD